ncbi:MAG: alpha/beta fold hydrolase [Acidimicrobiales bacterium]
MLTSFDGGRLFGQVHGSGPPRVLALHGWRRDHRDFDQVLGGEPPRGTATNQALVHPTVVAPARSSSDAALPVEPVPAIALDLPGFGASPEPGEVWGSDEYARAVGAVLDAMAAPVVVVGHSFGGRVAVHFAAEHPDKVLGLVLSGAPLFPATQAAGIAVRTRRPPARYRVARTLAKSGVIGAERLEQMKQRYGSADYRAATGVMRDILVKVIAEEREEAYTPSLKAIMCPVELVWGELDTAAPPAVARRIASTLGAPSTVSVHPGIGHLTPLLIPGHLRRAIDRLLAPAGG